MTLLWEHEKLGYLEICAKKKSILQICSLFPPQRTVRQNMFLYYTVHIYSCVLHFIFRAFLFFFLPTHRADWCSAVSLSWYHIAEVEENLGCAFHQGTEGVELWPLSHRGLCPFATWITVPLRRDLKCLGRRMGSASHPHYLLEEILHAVFLNRLSTKINASLFPAVSSNWHLPQPAQHQSGFWKVHKREEHWRGKPFVFIKLKDYWKQYHLCKWM